MAILVDIGHVVFLVLGAHPYSFFHDIDIIRIENAVGVYVEKFPVFFVNGMVAIDIGAAYPRHCLHDIGVDVRVKGVDPVQYSVIPRVDNTIRVKILVQHRIPYYLFKRVAGSQYHVIELSS